MGEDMDAAWISYRSASEKHRKEDQLKQTDSVRSCLPFAFLIPHSSSPVCSACYLGDTAFKLYFICLHSTLSCVATN